MLPETTYILYKLYSSTTVSNKPPTTRIFKQEFSNFALTSNNSMSNSSMDKHSSQTFATVYFTSPARSWPALEKL